MRHKACWSSNLDQRHSLPAPCFVCIAEQILICSSAGRSGNAPPIATDGGGQAVYSRVTGVSVALPPGEEALKYRGSATVAYGDTSPKNYSSFAGLACG